MILVSTIQSRDQSFRLNLEIDSHILSALDFSVIKVMMKIILIVLVFIIELEESAKIRPVRNKLLFFEPDYNVREIPKHLTKYCGFQYIPYERQIQFSSKCFGLDSVRNVSEQNKETTSQRSVSSRILNGVNALKHEGPWTVQIAVKRKSWFGFVVDLISVCTGSLITTKHILTAAHCNL